MAEGGEGNASWQPLALAVVSGLLFGFSVVALDAAPADSGLLTPHHRGGRGARVAAGDCVGVHAASRRSRARAGTRWASRRGLTVPSRSERSWGLIAGVFLALANITLLLRCAMGQLAVVGVVLCLYPVTTAMLARVFLDERLTRKHIRGHRDRDRWLRTCSLSA